MNRDTDQLPSAHHEHLPTCAEGVGATAEDVRVRGPVVDAETRCAHYASPKDVVAIRFFCCRRWYPCLHCHAESEAHEIVPWPLDRREEVALLCGVCRRRFSIAEYMDTSTCRGCGAAFNPGCAAHYPVYFGG
ncbi:CHY zinc finger protein [Nesterenkonia aerolata]|uniref:CHY zinc finger protein n=1 Tax=Nesterenkonia aerolata TaxID=3074079 RepID=A0ABU2DPS1_9MICC|nr:CHY zinc finger protein [Nesterenkonia sp. LY-0111]MDR8018513.1 CHY zinc finger protein [Nesterenkonia sp. LY-0111]